MFNSKKSNTRRPRLEAWFWSRASLTIAAMLFASFSVFYWAKPFWIAGEYAQSAFVAVLFTVSAAVTPTVVPKLVHAQGAAFGGIFFVCVAFGVLDTVGVTGGFLGLDREMSQKAYDAAVAVYDAEKSDLETERDAYRDEIKALRAKFGMSGEVRNANSLELLISDPIKERDRVQGLIDALEAPERVSRFNIEVAGLISALLQIALAIGLMALESARVRKHRDAVAEYEADLEQRRKDKEKKERQAQKAEARADLKVV